MDALDPAHPVLSRRRLIGLSGAVAGGVGLVATGCGGGPGDPAPEGADSANTTDAGILGISLDLEHEQVAAYTAALGHLTGEPRRRATAALAQERVHVSALSRAISSLLGVPSPPRPTYRFPPLRDQTAALRFLAASENTTIAAHIDALARLSHPRWRALTASILTADASHLAVLSGSLGQPAATGAFVTGRA